MILQEQLKGSMYIGDGVYVSHDGRQFWLKTSNGIEVTNRIALEPKVLDNFIVYVQEKGHTL